jgi:hypothetical protein
LEIHLALAPGVSSGTTTMYEDDGISTDYVTKQQYYKTVISFSRPAANKISISVAAPVGNGYSSFPSERVYTFKYIGAPPGLNKKKLVFVYSCVLFQKASVVVNGVSTSWSYEGATMHVVIVTDSVSTSSELTVSIVVADPSLEGVLFGIQGQVGVVFVLFKKVALVYFFNFFVDASC